MDLNNNYQVKESKIPIKSVNISFTNELDVHMKIPNQDFKFNKFQNKEFKDIKINLKKSPIDSQNLQSDCYEQFSSLIDNQFKEELGVNYNDKLKEFHIIEFFQHLDYLNSNFKISKPRTIEEFNIFLLKLIFITQSKLKLQSPNELSREKSSENQLEKEKNNLDDYLKNLSTEKLFIYKDKLEKTIEKLNNDLVDQLEIRDTNHLKKDDLFRKIEASIKVSLQLIKSNDLNQNPKI